MKFLLEFCEIYQYMKCTYEFFLVLLPLTFDLIICYIGNGCDNEMCQVTEKALACL